jgi:hypothetical protein
LPGIEIDVAAPEELLDSSVTLITIGNQQAFAYSLERTAGEKMRAFLSTLPTYRLKLKKPGNAVLAKDLYDLARILHFRPLENRQFWDIVGQEFRIACQSRFIDCAGLETFTEQEEVTRSSYTKDATIPTSEISVDEAFTAIRKIIEYMSVKKIIPFEFPIP